MPFVKIYLHTVWSTKNRLPFLSNKFRNKIFDHIKEYAKSKDIFIDFINGVSDHVHCLISMKSNQTICEIMQLIKGESAHWINQQGFLDTRFSWQEEYFAVSIGEAQVKSIRKYIRDQEAHHKLKTFQQEYDDYIIGNGFN
jgi:putative transposase